MQRENWKPVLGYEGLYEVSDGGRVRSLERDTPFNKSDTGPTVRHVPARTLKLLKRKDYMYPYVILYGAKRPRTPKFFCVHVLVLNAFRGPKPDGLICCHNNGDPLDNRLANLRWDTYSSNARDTLTHARQRKEIQHAA